jgi:predicted nuclease of predicted toxin-antitoxin system
MKLLFDQNISHRILKIMTDQMQGSSHVKMEGLINSSDRQIWDFAKLHNFTIVTQDSDFNDLNTLLGFPPKIIWLRIGNLQTKVILEILIDHIDEIKHFIENIDFGCYEIQKFTL